MPALPASPKAVCASQQEDTVLAENKLTHINRPSNQCLINQLATLSRYTTHCIGVAGKVVFLDTHSLVCTADLNKLEDSKELYVRHFFAPYNWFSGSKHIISILARRDVLITRKSDLAVIRGGLEYILPVESPGLGMKVSIDTWKRRVLLLEFTTWYRGSLERNIS